MSDGSVPGWLATARAAANAPPARHRQPLFLGAANLLAPVEVGSIEAALGARLRAAGLPVRSGEQGWHVVGESDAALHAVACWLHDEGLCRHWRDELLDVVDRRGEPVAVVERGVVRVLGITTRSAHLVGRAANGNVWVQQRALDKATDPGAWDTLVGGLVAAGESVLTALQRETLEEAGLELEQLQGLRASGRLTVRRPLPEGYMVEHIEIFEACVADGIEPVNRDGEVERFACLDAESMRAQLAAGAFTLEATLILSR